MFKNKNSVNIWAGLKGGISIGFKRDFFSAAKALIGYEPIASLAEGLAETVHWSRRVLAGKDA
jgi:hypothetical protein